MNCEKIQDLFQVYLENKLDTKTKEELENHLKGCADCSQFLKEFKSTIELLKTLGEKELPDDYYNKLNLKLAGAQTILQSDKRLFLGIKQSFIIPATGILLFIISIGIYFLGINKKVSIINITKENNVKEENVVKNKGTSIQEQTKVASIPQSEKQQNNIKENQLIEIKKTIELAMATTDEKSQYVLRGAGPKYEIKKFIKQWQDTTSGIKEKKSVIIKTQQEWQNLWQEHTGSLKSIPEIDFNKNIVVAVFMGEQKTSGYGIQISQIEESNDKIYIETIETVPASGAIVTKQLTQPYHIVVVSKD